MSNMILSPADITASKIEFGPLKVLDNGGKAVNLRYAGNNIMVETPSLSVPYGVNVYDKEGPTKLKYSVDLSLRGADENEQVRALQDFLEAFDERMIDAGVENAAKWFKMSNPNREVIRAFYTPLVKISKDALGNPKPYPPTFKLSLRKKKDGSFDTDFYNGTERDEEGQIVPVSKDTPIEQVIPKRSQLTAIIQCTGVWFAGSKFGTTWKLVQGRLDSKPDQIRGPAFRSEAPDIRAFAAKAIGSSAAAASAPREIEYNDSEEEDNLMAAVLPAKVAAPAPKAAAPKPDPEPEAETVAFDEEQVSAPAPVPKKVTTVKKIIKKSA
jgi:hypothetical protein